MTEMTPWFSGKVKPKRKGVYLRKFFDGKEHYSRWNGKHWCSYWMTRQDAAMETRESQYQQCEWRGLAEQPK